MVIVGVHGTPGSLQALRFAVGHARMFGATLVPVIAWQLSSGHRVPVGLADEWAAEADQRLLTAFDEVWAVFRRTCPPGRWWSAARSGAAFQDSPTRYCVRHARCSVILVPPSELTVELQRGIRRQRYSRSLG